MKKIILLVLLTSGLFAQNCQEYLDLSIKDYKSAIDSKDATISTAYSTQSMASMTMYNHCKSNTDLQDIKNKIQELINIQKKNLDISSTITPLGTGY